MRQPAKPTLSHTMPYPELCSIFCFAVFHLYEQVSEKSVNRPGRKSVNFFCFSQVNREILVCKDSSGGSPEHTSLTEGHLFWCFLKILFMFLRVCCLSKWVSSTFLSVSICLQSQFLVLYRTFGGWRNDKGNSSQSLFSIRNGFPWG